MKQYILMADIIKSSSYDQADVINQFKQIVDAVNLQCRDQIISPLTITLGDEFQGVCRSLAGALTVMLTLKQKMLELRVRFLLRFVCVYGEIDTKINEENSYGMLGSGLTQARMMLTKKKRDDLNLQLRIRNTLIESILQNTFEIMHNIENNTWKRKDKAILFDFIYEQNQDGDYLTDTEIGRRHDKHQSQISKYRGTWDIESYRSAMALINTIMVHILEPESELESPRLNDVPLAA